MSATMKGYPYPDATDANNVPADIEALAEAVDASPGIASLTTVQRDALSGGDLWAGRTVWNQTTTRLQWYTGSAWLDVQQGAWTDYSSALTVSGAGWSLTGATVTAAYSVVGKTVNYRGKIVVGARAYVGTGVLLVSLPVAASAGSVDACQGVATIADIGTQIYAASCRVHSTTELLPLVLPAAGSYLARTTVINTRPHAWDTGDWLSWSIAYEAA